MDRRYRLLNWLRSRRTAARAPDAADMGIDWALELILADRAGLPRPADRRHAAQAATQRPAPPPA